MAFLTKPLPPKGHRHHHRPVISFKELKVSCEQLAVSSTLLMNSSCAESASQVFTSAYCLPLTRCLDSQPCNRRFVFLGIGICEHALLEPIQLPNFQVRQITEHRDFADNLRALSQQRMNQYATLRVHHRLLTVVIRSVKELASCRVH